MSNLVKKGNTHNRYLNKSAISIPRSYKSKDLLDDPQTAVNSTKNEQKEDITNQNKSSKNNENKENQEEESKFFTPEELELFSKLQVKILQVYGEGTEDQQKALKRLERFKKFLINKRRINQIVPEIVVSEHAEKSEGESKISDKLINAFDYASRYMDKIKMRTMSAEERK